MIRFRLPWTFEKPSPPPPEEPPKKRKVTKDEQREGYVVGRNAKWRKIKDEGRHLDAISYVGATSEIGRMSLEQQRRMSRGES